MVLARAACLRAPRQLTESRPAIRFLDYRFSLTRGASSGPFVKDEARWNSPSTALASRVVFARSPPPDRKVVVWR